MYNEAYDLLEKYNEKHICVGTKFIEEIFYMIREYYNYQAYVTYCVFDKLPGDLARFDDVTKTMIFDLSKPRFGDYMKNFPEVFYLFYNAAILLDIYHEFVHVDQTKIYDDVKINDLLFNILDVSIPFANRYDPLFNIKRAIFERYYKKNWSMEPHERMANILSVIHLLDTIMNIPSDILGSEQLKKSMVLKLDNFCLRNYKLNGNMTNSPTIDYITKAPFGNHRHLLDEERYRKLFLDPNLPLEKRVLYGFAITKEEFLPRVDAHNNFIKDVDESLRELTKTLNKR